MISLPINDLYSGNFLGFFINLLLILPALVIAVSFHEAAHAWMSNKMGDPTARNLGRLTLDPTKHISLLGFLSFALVGFGWGKPVPTNPRNYYNYKKGNALVALAGVSVNLIISIVTVGIIALMYHLGAFNSITSDRLGSLMNILLVILLQIAFFNLVLCFFNLIPIPPLDGHHLVKGFIARISPRFFMYYNQYGYIALIVILFFIPGVRQGFSNLIFFVFKAITSLFGLTGLFGF
jgi:Zn-dependent protease